MGKKSLKLVLLALFAQLTVGSIAKAQEAEMVETGTVVVSGTLSEQLVEDVPATMQVITEEDIKRYGATTVVDVMKNVQGMQTFGLNGNMSMRGMPSDWTIVLVDGRRAAIQETQRESNMRLLSSINIANIERIEIIRGSAAAQYGSSASGGVINIITKKSKEKSIMVGATYEESKFTNYWNLDSGQMGQWDFLLGAQYQQFLGDRNSYEKYHSSHYPGNWYENKDGNEWYINANIGYKMNENNEFRLIVDYNQYDYSTTNNRWQNTAAKGDPADYKYVRSTSHRKNKDYSAVLEYHGNTDNHMFDISASFNNMTVYSLNSDGSTKTSDDYYRYGIKANDYWTINDMFALSFGGEYYIDGSNYEGYLKDTKGVFAAYVIGEISLFDEALFVVPSVRFDYDEVSGESITPQLGVTWEFIEDHRLKGNIGLGYRAPNMTDLYGENGHGNGADRGNPNLEPEESFNVELRYEGEWKDLTYAVGYYYSEIDNRIDGIITTEEIPDRPGRYYYDLKNITGTSVFQGFEAELAYDFLKYFTASLNYSYSDTRNPDDSRVKQKALHTYKGQLTFYQPEWDLSASVWGTYHGDFIYDSRSLGAVETNFATASMSLSKGWKDGKYRTFMALENFLTSDENIRNYSYVGDLNLRVGLEMKF